eukprot:3085782-Rhodomonas_salina.2
MQRNEVNTLPCFDDEHAEGSCSPLFFCPARSTAPLSPVQIRCRDNEDCGPRNPCTGAALKPFALSCTH